MKKHPPASIAQKKSKPLTIVMVPVDDLNPAPYNPRKWDQAAVANLKESIKRFGFVDPLIVNGAPNRKNVIIGGHFRFSIAKELGMTEVPVVYVDIPNVEKEKELNLRLNRNTGEWDFEKLKDFDMGLLLKAGFDDTDLSAIWDGMLETEDDDFDVEKELEKIKKPKSKPGNLFALGNHRLLCGDSTRGEDVQRLVGKRTIDMLYCDPPYNIDLDYDKGVGNAMRYGGQTDDSKPDAEYRAFLKATMENGLAVCKPDCHVFYYCDERYIGLLQSLYSELGLEHRRVCLWIKNNMNLTPNNAFNKAYEACVYATRGHPFLSPKLQNLHEILNREVGSGNRAIDDVLDLLNIWMVKRLHSSEYEHPTQKPPTLHEKALRRCTKVGDSVLDLFGGSGSTLIACDQLKRHCFLMEAEPIFCDLILTRYETLTSQKPERID